MQTAGCAAIVRMLERSSAALRHSVAEERERAATPEQSPAKSSQVVRHCSALETLASAARALPADAAVRLAQSRATALLAAASAIVCDRSSTKSAGKRNLRVMLEAATNTPAPALLRLFLSELRADCGLETTNDDGTVVRAGHAQLELFGSATAADLTGGLEQIASLVQLTSGKAGDAAALYTEKRMMQEALAELRGLLEVAEWVATADLEALGGSASAGTATTGNASWLHRYLPAILQGGLCSLVRIFEEVDESGDLRQLGVDKAPAKALFKALEVR